MHAVCVAAGECEIGAVCIDARHRAQTYDVGAHALAFRGERVEAVAACGVRAGIAAQHVRAGVLVFSVADGEGLRGAFEEVVAGAARQCVRAAASPHVVVSVVAEQAIFAVTSAQMILPTTAGDEVGA